MKNESNAIFEAYVANRQVIAEKKTSADQVIEEGKAKKMAYAKKEHMKKDHMKNDKKALVKEKLEQLKSLIDQASKSVK